MPTKMSTTKKIVILFIGLFALVILNSGSNGKEDIIDSIDMINDASTQEEANAAMVNAAILADEQRAVSAAAGLVAIDAAKQARNFNYKKRTGYQYFGGNLSCGNSKNLNQIRNACSADTACLGFTMRNNLPQCLKKSLAGKRLRRQGFDTYIKEGSKESFCGACMG